MNNRLINILSDRIYYDLQNLQEKRRKKRKKKKKKNPGGRSVKYRADDNMGVSQMDFLPTDVLKDIAKKRNLDEYVEELSERKKRRKRRKKRRKSSKKKPSQDPSYARGRKNPGALDKAVSAYNKAKKTPGKADDMRAIAMRDRLEKREKPSGIPSKYNMSENLSRESLRRLIFEILQDEISERKRRKKRRKRKKKSGARKLSSKVDKSLKKKAKSANAPVGALKAIYRKGMGAFYSSGSRSGQNPHSWAMARVNSVLRGGKTRSVDSAQ